MWKSETRRTTVAFLWPCWKWSTRRRHTRACTLAITTTRRRRRPTSRAGVSTSMCQVSRAGACSTLVVLVPPADRINVLRNRNVPNIYGRKGEKYERTHNINSRSLVRPLSRNMYGQRFGTVLSFRNHFYHGTFYWHCAKNLKCPHFCSVQPSLTSICS